MSSWAQERKDPVDRYAPRRFVPWELGKAQWTLNPDWESVGGVSIYGEGNPGLQKAMSSVSLAEQRETCILR